MSHHETCARCEGGGQIGCPVCHGVGEVTHEGDFEDEKKTCTSCKGTGKVRCHACAGSGTVKIDD